jgi:hypothetical protein
VRDHGLQLLRHRHAWYPGSYDPVHDPEQRHSHHLDAGIAARSDNNSNVQVVIKNNTIGRATSPRSGSYRDRGIFMASDDSSDFIASVENNVIHSTFFEGISASTTDGTGLSPKMDMTI